MADLTGRSNPDQHRVVHQYPLPGPHDLEVWENVENGRKGFVLVLGTRPRQEHAPITEKHAGKLLLEALRNEVEDDD